MGVRRLALRRSRLEAPRSPVVHRRHGEPRGGRAHEAYGELDSWLRELGVDVWWTTVAPFAAWSVPGSSHLNGVRLRMNDWLRVDLADQLIDCESDLLVASGPWLHPRYVLPGDGVHLSGAGAGAHARCIARALEADPADPQGA